MRFRDNAYFFAALSLFSALLHRSLSCKLHPSLTWGLRPQRLRRSNEKSTSTIFLQAFPRRVVRGVGMP